jgi:pimeloyl-ACP methyl ester carboxylesterase
MDYTAAGDTTNVAARLLALAEPGQVLISEDTAKAVGPYFLLQPLGSVIVKGKALPIQTFRVEAAGQEFRIITIDPRGQGGSDPLPRPYSLRDHAEDVRAVVESTTTRPVVFIGISKTGKLGVHFAMAYPHLVEKLITVGTAPASAWASDFPGQLDRDFWAHTLALIRAGHYQKLFELHNPRVLSEPGCRNLIETRLRLGRVRKAVRAVWSTVAAIVMGTQSTRGSW